MNIDDLHPDAVYLILKRVGYGNFSLPKTPGLPIKLLQLSRSSEVLNKMMAEFLPDDKKWVPANNNRQLISYAPRVPQSRKYQSLSDDEKYELGIGDEDEPYGQDLINERYTEIMHIVRWYAKSAPGLKHFQLYMFCDEVYLDIEFSFLLKRFRNSNVQLYSIDIGWGTEPSEESMRRAVSCLEAVLPTSANNLRKIVFSTFLPVSEKLINLFLQYPLPSIVEIEFIMIMTSASSSTWNVQNARSLVNHCIKSGANIKHLAFSGGQEDLINVPQVASLCDQLDSLSFKKAFGLSFGFPDLKNMTKLQPKNLNIKACDISKSDLNNIFEYIQNRKHEYLRDGKYGTKLDLDLQCDHSCSKWHNDTIQNVISIIEQHKEFVGAEIRSFKHDWILENDVMLTLSRHCWNLEDLQIWFENNEDTSTVVSLLTKSNILRKITIKNVGTNHVNHEPLQTLISAIEKSGCPIKEMVLETSSMDLEIFKRIFQSFRTLETLYISYPNMDIDLLMSLAKCFQNTNNLEDDNYHHSLKEIIFVSSIDTTALLSLESPEQGTTLQDHPKIKELAQAIGFSNVCFRNYDGYDIGHDVGYGFPKHWE